MMAALRDGRAYGEANGGSRANRIPGAARADALAWPPLALWATRSHRYLRRRCDGCRRWRPWQRLFEAYPDAGRADEGWLLICGDCMATRLSDLVARLKTRDAG
jgi:hypothetical protein